MIAINTPEFIKYINELNPKTKVILECPQCHNMFVRSKHVIQSKFGPYNKIKTIYCSHKCACEAKITLQQVQCLQCKTDFYKKQNQVIKFTNHFCSHSCSAKYNNTHKTKGNRRSKLEIWLESELKILYPNYIIEFNNKKAINSELDIYIPSLNLAFELNGIFHYEPIYGPDKLNLIQNNDSRKFQACLECNIELVIIDVSNQKYFKISTSQKYLSIIKNIISNKIGAINDNRNHASSLAS